MKFILQSHTKTTQKLRDHSHLQFGISEFPFVTVRIIHGVVTFNGDNNQSECGASTSNPSEASTCYQTAQHSAGDAIWMSERVDENVERQKNDCHHHVRHRQVYEKIVERYPVKYEMVDIVSVANT